MSLKTAARSRRAAVAEAPAPSWHELNAAHLQSELARIDLLIQRQVARFQRAGQDLSDDLRGLYISNDEAVILAARPLGTNWAQDGPETPEEAAHFAQSYESCRRSAQSIAAQARALAQPVCLERLAALFTLTPHDTDILLLCLAPWFDLRYERLYGYLQDDLTRKKPGVNLLLDLLAEPGMSRFALLSHLQPDSPLIRHRLLDLSTDALPLLGQSLTVDESIARWLLGTYQPRAALQPFVRQFRPAEAQPSVPVSPPDELLQAAASRQSDSPVLVLYGPDEAAQEAAALAVIQHIDLPVLRFDPRLSPDDEREPGDLLAFTRLAARDAALLGAVLWVCHFDACLDDGLPIPEVLSAIVDCPAPVIITGQSLWRAQGINRTRRLFWYDFFTPAYNQRKALWSALLESHITDDLLTNVAGQFLLTSGQVRDAVNTALDTAAQTQQPLREEDLMAAARAHSSARLESLARKITPRYAWHDIVLPTDQVSILREIVQTVRGRSLVLGEWGVGQKLVASQGITVLFAGPPGTGKTMAAEILAGELALDLYKIDLSTIVSKYIGETEKNLERIFSEADASGAILFFDEADALFGKRSEVRDSHDRYANIEISYLLQRMEAYDGVAILATNLRANLDEAFTRRLQFVIDFPFPDESDRLRIWQALFPPGVPRADGINLSQLARRYKLAGGNIRNVIVSAAYLAAADGRAVTTEHLLHAIRRELQKMGRLVDEGDLR